MWGHALGNMLLSVLALQKGHSSLQTRAVLKPSHLYQGCLLPTRRYVGHTRVCCVFLDAVLERGRECPFLTIDDPEGYSE